jgi:hypothetical protein
MSLSAERLADSRLTSGNRNSCREAKFSAFDLNEPFGLQFIRCLPRDARLVTSLGGSTPPEFSLAQR